MNANFPERIGHFTVLYEAIPTVCAPSNIKILKEQLESFNHFLRELPDAFDAFTSEWPVEYHQLKISIVEADSVHGSWAQKKVLFERVSHALQHAIKQLIFICKNTMEDNVG